MRTTFYLRRARVSLSGDAAKEKIDYRLQVDMAGSPKVCDLYFRYKPLNQLNIQLGQYKLPFSLENELYGPTKFEFIEYSYLTTYLVRNDKKYDGISATGRDMGVQLYGSFLARDGYSILNYNIGVFNGAGINAKDNNSSKDFIARLIVKPIKGLSINLSPATYKLVYANIADANRVNVTEYGIEEGENILNEIGSALRVEWKWKPLREIHLDTKFYFFTNYKQIETELEINVDFIINRYLSAKLMLHPRYDGTVEQVTDQRSQIQFKELISVGFAHTFR